MRLKREITPERALMRMEELCVRAEHCSGEIIRKLRTWHIAPEDIEAIVASLRKRRFIDDARFARAFVRDKYRFNRWGRMKIRLELRAKGVDQDIIDEAMDEIDDDIYREGLLEFLRARSRSYENEEPYARRQKLLRAGAARGFEIQIITETIKKLEKSKVK